MSKELRTGSTPAAAAAGYRPGVGFRRCWNCQHFTLPAAEAQAGEAGSERPEPTCAVLRIPIEPTAVCDRWLQMADRAKKRTGFRSALRRHGEFLWDEAADGEGRERGEASDADPGGGGVRRDGPAGL